MLGFRKETPNPVSRGNSGDFSLWNTEDLLSIVLCLGYCGGSHGKGAESWQVEFGLLYAVANIIGYF